MRELLIGLAGKARTGKDTAANFIERYYGLEPMSFAAPIRQAVADMFALTPAHINGDLKEELLPLFGKSPRQLFQTLGTEWGRELVHPDVWVKVAQINIDRFRSVYAEQGDILPGFVFSDVRFENEARFIRDHGGLLIHLDRPTASPVANHISESGIERNPGDQVVVNDGTLAELCRLIKHTITDHYGL